LAIGLLAALIRKGQIPTGEDVRRAIRFLKQIPQMVNAPFNELSTEEMHDSLIQQIAQPKRGYEIEQTRKITIRFFPNSEYKLEDCVTFKEALDEPWCNHKSLPGLERFMRKAGYDEDLIPYQINFYVYEDALKKAAAAKRLAERNRKRASYKNKPVKSKAAAEKKPAIAKKKIAGTEEIDPEAEKNEGRAEAEKKRTNSR